MSQTTQSKREFGFFRIEPVHYAGMPVGLDRKWWHRLLPLKWPQYRDHPTYEAALIGGLRETVVPGAQIVVVGAGIGVTVVSAARLAGPNGQVTCYEGSSDCLQKTQETLDRNSISGGVSLVQAIVAEDISVYSSATKSDVVPASDLPACDVLQLDCEGAEVKILSELQIRPDVILVETHGIHGAPTAKVLMILENLGYQVEDCGVAEPYLEEYCKENDIRVLLGRKILVNET